MFKRSLDLPAAGSLTFFLWGSRQTGKSTLLKSCYPDALWLDLLRSEQYRKYLAKPSLLREEVEDADASFVVIDEVQKLPELLDEVHWLHERRGVHFALCGSSARKVKRGKANLLGGRAARFELRGLVADELGAAWDLTRLLNRGYLPRHYLNVHPQRLLNAYVSDYLREEVAAEGLVRNLSAFADFMNAAAFSDTELVNMSNIARDCGVSSQTVKGYFDILVDTLIGRWLPAYRRQPKRRVIRSPKFYWSDVGVVNFLTRRGKLEPATPLFGKAFENWIHHELTAYLAYRETFVPLHYWRLASGIEVDFLTADLRLAVEAKATGRVHRAHLKGLRQLAVDQPGVRRRVVVSLEQRPRRTKDGVTILPATDFVQRLWADELY